MKLPTLLLGEWYDDLGDVVNHCCFIRPVVGRVRNVPICWKADSGMALICFSLIHKLHREKFSSDCGCKHSCDLPFVIKASNFYSFSIVHEDTGT